MGSPLDLLPNQGRGITLYGSTPGSRPVALPPRKPLRSAMPQRQGGSVYDRIAADQRSTVTQQNEDQGNPFGRGLGFLINNPVTQAALKPLEVLDYGRRAVTLGLEELSEGLFGELPAHLNEDGTLKDTRSNWDKLKDPTYGVGQLLRDVSWDDSLGNFFDKGVGFVGDVALDPLSYVGGFGFATKAASAGGRAARAANASKALGAAAKRGDDIEEAAAQAQKVTQRGYANATPQQLEDMGVRGGIRLSTNPIMPYKGKQITIPLTERLTAPLSRARMRASNEIGDTFIGRGIDRLRTPDGLEDAYSKLFRGKGDISARTALNKTLLYQLAREKQGLIRPLTVESDNLAHKSRNMSEEDQIEIVNSLENPNVQLEKGDKGFEFQDLLNRAWRFAVDNGLRLEFRKDYSPHIMTREMVEWRKAGNSFDKNPTGFFTERVYDPSGITMGRSLGVGDTFKINDKEFVLKEATIKEFNEKAREAGLNFDVFESDPGVIVQKYLNMLSDDIAVVKAVPELRNRLGAAASLQDSLKTNRVPTSDGSGLPVTSAGGRVLPGGIDATDDDARLLAESLGIEPDNPLLANYSTKVNEEGSKAINEELLKQLKAQNKAAKENRKKLRNEINTRLRLVSSGKAEGSGDKSLNNLIKERQEAAKKLSKQVQRLSSDANKASADLDELIDRYIVYDNMAKGIQDEIDEINQALAAIEVRAVPDMMGYLRAQRRTRENQIKQINEELAEFRKTVAKRSRSVEDLKNTIELRRQQMYDRAGVEPPTSSIKGAGVKPSSELGIMPRPQAHALADAEVAAFVALRDGKAAKRKINKVAQLTGETAEEVEQRLRKRVKPEPSNIPKEEMQAARGEGQAVLQRAYDDLVTQIDLKWDGARRLRMPSKQYSGVDKLGMPAVSAKPDMRGESEWVENIRRIGVPLRWFRDRGVIVESPDTGAARRKSFGSEEGISAEDLSTINGGKLDPNEAALEFLRDQKRRIELERALKSPKDIPEEYIGIIAQELNITDVEAVRKLMRNFNDYQAHMAESAANSLEYATRLVMERIPAEDFPYVADAMRAGDSSILAEVAGLDPDVAMALDRFDQNTLAEWLESQPRRNTDIPDPEEALDVEPAPPKASGNRDQLMADILEERSEIDRIESLANRIPQIQKKIEAVESDLKKLIDSYGGEANFYDRNKLGAALQPERQRLANEGQERALAARNLDGYEAKAAREESKALVSKSNNLVDLIYAKVAKDKALVDRLKASLPRLEKEAESLPKKRKDLNKKIEEFYESVPPRTPSPPPRDRTLARDAADSQRRLDRMPTVGRESNNVPPGSGTGGRFDDAKRNQDQRFLAEMAQEAGVPNLRAAGLRGEADRFTPLEKKKQIEPRPEVRLELEKEVAEKKSVVERLEKEIDEINRKIRDDSVVATLKKAEIEQRVMEGKTPAGPIFPSKLDLPPNPNTPKYKTGKYTNKKNLKGPDTEWTEAVDRIYADAPKMKKLPKYALPPVGVATRKLQEAYKNLIEKFGLAEKRRELEFARADLVHARKKLEGSTLVADEPDILEGTLKAVRDKADPGEAQSIGRLRQELRARKQDYQKQNQADKARAQELIETGKQTIEPDIKEIDESIKAIITDPEAREAIKRDALSTPEAVREAEKRRELERQLVETNKIAAKTEREISDATAEFARLKADSAAISAEHISASKAVGEARGYLARVGQLNPKNRARWQPMEDFLAETLESDPDLLNIPNQAAVHQIKESERIAKKLKGVLEEIEETKLGERHKKAGRIVEFVLNDNVEQFMPELFGPGGPVADKAFIQALSNTKKAASNSRFWDNIDKLTALFKTYAVLTPGFHVRNAISAAFVNATDDVGVADMARSISIMNGYGRAAKAGNVREWLAEQGNKVLNEETGATVKDALDAVAGTGVGGRYREHGVADRTLARNKLTERLFENTLTYFLGKKPGTFIESSVRLPVAIDTLRRGGSTSDAAQRISRLHFDYSEVSKLDQSMRRIIPFWTFMSRNLPLQFAQMYTKPRSYAKYNSLVRNLRGEDEPNTPGYFDKVGAFRLGAATYKSMPVFLQPDLAHTRLVEDIERYTDLSDPAGMLSDTNPLFSAPAEYIFGKDAFTGREYDDTDVREAGLVEKPIEVLARLIGVSETTPEGRVVVPEKMLNAFRSVIPVYDRSVRLAPNLVTKGGDGGGANSRAFESWARLIGVPIRTLSPEQQLSTQRSNYFQSQDEIAMKRALAAIDSRAS